MVFKNCANGEPKNKVDIYQLVNKVWNFVKLCREYPNGLELPEFIVSMHHWRPVVSFPDNFLYAKEKYTWPSANSISVQRIYNCWFMLMFSLVDENIETDTARVHDCGKAIVLNKNHQRRN